MNPPGRHVAYATMPIFAILKALVIYISYRDISMLKFPYIVGYEDIIHGDISERCKNGYVMAKRIGMMPKRINQHMNTITSQFQSSMTGDLHSIPVECEIFHRGCRLHRPNPNHALRPRIHHGLHRISHQVGGGLRMIQAKCLYGGAASRGRNHL